MKLIIAINTGSSMKVLGSGDINSKQVDNGDFSEIMSALTLAMQEISKVRDPLDFEYSIRFE